MIRIPLTAVYTMVAATLAAAIAPGDAGAQVLPPLEDTLGTLEERLPPLEERVRSRAEEAAEAAERAGESAAETADEAVDTVTATTGDATETAGGVVDGVTRVADTLRPFTLDSDPYGRAIERDVLIVLVEESEIAAVTGFGLDVIAERDLPGLGMTLVTLRAGGNVSLGMVAEQVRRAVPPATVDYNHLYESTTDTDVEPSDAAAEAAPAVDPALRIGLIDSAVEASHPALEGSRIVAADFAPHEGERPLGHGTAVASLLAGATAGRAEIHSASVFFRLPRRLPGATTESLVAALDWLVEQDVDAINMSLSGPPNALLERALAGMASDGPVVVAAVGNNGPDGAPMFPAAYAGVIGVTAVDRDRRIFRAANRGGHVAFAARGVNVEVADVRNGGYRVESGTSMASPFIAAVAAAERRGGRTERGALMESLIASAEDLGERGFDDVFGHGLIARRPAIVSNVRTSPED